jgi:RNA polymerase sigma-70 factor (ECF subfamily)
VSVNTVSEPGLDVAACVERVCQGDENAARELFNHLYPLVLRLVRAHLPRRTGADDLTQIVFMKVFANLDRHSGAAPLEHWVSRIAINTCLNEIAAEKIRPELRLADLSEEQIEVIENLTTTATDLRPDQSLAARELVEELLQLVDPRDRLLITLLHVEGCSPKEVERITGWNGAVIRVRAFRARKKLREHFPKLMKEKQNEKIR